MTAITANNMDMLLRKVCAVSRNAAAFIAYVMATGEIAGSKSHFSNLQDKALTKKQRH